MAKYTIRYDRTKCISAGNCVKIAPGVWEFDSEGIAKPKKTSLSEAELNNNIEAAKSCPTQAIEIYDEKGKKVA